MSHLNFSINLFKLKNCAVTNLTSSRTGESKKCLIIPIEDNSLTVTEKGFICQWLLLNLINWRNNLI